VRTRLIVLLAVLTTTAAALAGCGGGGGARVSQGSQALGHTEINPQPRDNIRDGGDLRIPLDIFPGNFNFNEVDGSDGSLNQIELAALPYLFHQSPDGGYAIDHDYLTSAAITSTTPQVITYTINPKATWSDGTPITYRDFEAYWRSLNGTNPAYQPAGTTGYNDISSVARGVDDKQVVVTFKQPFGEWESLFFPLTPASLNSSPAAFNEAWRTNLPVTAGPFRVQSIDQTSKTVTLARDPKWWGTPPKLDHIIFKVYDDQAEPDALANNELDIFPINANIDLLRRAQTTSGVVIRNAPGRISSNVTFNGSPGAALADPRLRKAIAQGINRAEITRRSISQIVPDAAPDGNHFYAPGSKEYQDNASALPYDPTAARNTLASLGYGPGNHKPALRLVYGLGSANGEDIAKTVQNQLGQLGVTVELRPVDQNQLFPTYIDRGDFDLAMFAWESTAAPLSSAFGIYAQPIGDNVLQNYGRVGSPEIDGLLRQATAELDDTKRAAIGNQADRLIWQQAHSVILFARPGAVAVRQNLANFGAAGFSDPNYIDAGFVK
jgi:peptide/nickel transport system substrate-binding protein